MRPRWPAWSATIRYDRVVYCNGKEMSWHLLISVMS